MKKIFLISCLILSSCLSKEPIKEIIVKESKIVEVERITLSKGKFQYFIISGKDFEFKSKEITFNIGDTIVLKDSIAYPKNKINLIVKII
jgi:hypothetical protein